MSHILTLTFQITLLGMGLVFGALLLLWGLMALLVRLAPERVEQNAEPGLSPQAAVPGTETISETSGEDERRHRAAAAAVAIALAQELDHTPHAFPTPPSAAVSPWQAISRAKAMDKLGRSR